jgi:hypothetical protein
MIILLAFFAPIKPHATEQMRDILIHNGKTYLLEVNILYPYLAKANKWEWIGKGWCTALWRGYYAEFEVVNNELVLKDIRNCSESLLNEFLSAFNVKDSIFKLDWFTGPIVIAEGKPLLYLDIHEYYSKFHFEKGMLIKETRIDYKEYLIIKYLKELFRLKESKKDKDTRTFLEKYNVQEYLFYLEAIEYYLETKKKAEFIAKLKILYEKKFGQPISESELKIHKISFWGFSEYNLEINRTLYGARAIYSTKNSYEWIEVKLNMEEWLDFIRALYTCCLDKWEPSNYNYDCSLCKGTLWVHSNEDFLLHYNEFPIKNTKQPNLNEFEKVIEDMITKIKRNR